MSLVALPFPDFTTSAVLENGKILNSFNCKEYLNKKMGMIFFWPMDFTFVCPSELIALNNSFFEFSKRGVKIIGISVDSVYVHSAWRRTLPKDGGIGEVKYVMASDVKREIQQSYGIEHPDLGIALRGAFIIDRKGIIRHQTVNDLPFGRNIKEFIRIIDSINFYEKNGEVCPVNWNVGKSGMHPSFSGMKEFLNIHAKNL